MVRRWLPALILVAALVPTAAALACPNCKEAVAAQADPDAARLADGYSWSILLMLGMPLLLAASGTMMVVRLAKRGAFPEF